MHILCTLWKRRGRGFDGSLAGECGLPIDGRLAAAAEYARFTVIALARLPLLIRCNRMSLGEFASRFRRPFLSRAVASLYHFGGAEVQLLAILLPLAYAHRYAVHRRTPIRCSTSLWRPPGQALLSEFWNSDWRWWQEVAPDLDRYGQENQNAADAVIRAKWWMSRLCSRAHATRGSGWAPCRADARRPKCCTCLVLHGRPVGRGMGRHRHCRAVRPQGEPVDSSERGTEACDGGPLSRQCFT